MSPLVHTEDLIDAHEVAKILGLTHPNSVSTYLKRYADMPPPVLELGRGRPRLWLRQAIEQWDAERAHRHAIAKDEQGNR